MYPREDMHQHLIDARLQIQHSTHEAMSWKYQDNQDTENIYWMLGQSDIYIYFNNDNMIQSSLIQLS